MPHEEARRYDTFEKLFVIAEGQEGYFTMRQALAAGVSRMAVIQAARRATKIERRSRGVYRLVQFPYVSSNGHLWEALLWPQVRTDVATALSHQTALRLHELSDVNVSDVHITVPKHARTNRDEAAAGLAIHRADLAPDDVIYVDGLPTTTIDRTLRDIAASAPGSPLLEDAVRDARKRNIPIPDAVVKAL